MVPKIAQKQIARSLRKLAEGNCDQPKLLEIWYFWYFWYPSMLFATSELVFLVFLVQFYSFATFLSDLVIAHSRTNITIQIVVKSIESKGSGKPTSSIEP